MNSIKQIKDFANDNKIREMIAVLMEPTVHKVELQCERMIDQIKAMHERTEILHRFQNQKNSLEKSLKHVKKDVAELQHNLNQIKTDTELAQNKLNSNVTTIRDEIHSMQRSLTRREETIQSYDRKLNGVMDSLSKQQSFVGDRMYVFQQKFKQLTKETLDMTKEVKRDFDNSMNSNQILKNQLIYKIKRSEDKEKVLDLYMSQREEISKKILVINHEISDCLKISQFEEFKKWQHKNIAQSLIKSKQLIQNCLPPATQQQLKQLNIKFAQITVLQQRTDKLQSLKLQLQKLSHKVQTVQTKGQNKIAQIKEEAVVLEEKIEGKIIEVVEKKIEIVEVAIGQMNNQNQESIQEKIAMIRKEFQSMVRESELKQMHELNQLKHVKSIDESGQEVIISRQLNTAKRERQKIQEQFKQIKSIADGLNQKLALFSNKITMCKSDIELFSESTHKQLKKISDIKRQQQANMELVGKVLSRYMQSLFILTSVMLHGNRKDREKEHNSFVTYHDGIVVEFGREEEPESISYRRHSLNVNDLKESLLYCLISLNDQIINNNHVFKWKDNKPSQFFIKEIKENIFVRERSPKRSQSMVSSPRKRNRKQNQDEQLFLMSKLESDDASKISISRPQITVTAANQVCNLDNPKSLLQKRYKLKRNQQKSQKQIEQRSCFTTSRSHRKTKPLYN